ncbi:MAG TPA: zf-HC2 domain-containing protein [Acidimicrobiia bacterium]|nr:zf-HC2 domain-containing protein [Acidimicrobiia bacterium]
MTHDEIQDLLEGYVDETLDRAARREVDAHLATCEGCRAILEGVAPVDLGSVEPSSWTARDMRRAVRRSMLRVAVDAVLIVIAATLVAWLVSLTLLHPLVINRGGRAEAATVATADLAVMFNPGVGVTEYLTSTSLLGRSVEVTLGRPVGNRIVEVGELATRIGVLGFGGLEGGRFFAYLDTDLAGYGDEEDLGLVSEGTVATVELWYEDPIDVETAADLIESDADVRIVWAGFAVGVPSSSGHGALAPGGVIGYGTCDGSVFEGDFGSSAGEGGSRTGFGMPASIDRALSETRRSVDNLAAFPDLLDGIGVSVSSAEAVLRDLADPEVSLLVVTGPTTEILTFLEETAPTSTRVIDVDFINWSQPMCGR